MQVIKAFYDRTAGTIEGAFTLQSYNPELADKPVKLFERLSARSGQAQATNTSWEPGKSPIPYGLYYLWLKPQNPGVWPTRAGIGEFYNISSGLDNKRLIQDKKTGQQRWDIGLHPENAFKGSAGCIVLVHDTPAQRAHVASLFSFLREYGKTHSYIELEVL